LLFLYQTAVEALDDDALFGNEEDEEEDGAFVMYVVFEFSRNHLMTMFLQGQFCRCTGRRFLGSSGVRYCCRVRHVEPEHSQEASERQEQGSGQTLFSCVRIYYSEHYNSHAVVLTGSVKTSAQPKEPPLPYPPPPPFVSIDSKNVEHQIGLLNLTTKNVPEAVPLTEPTLSGGLSIASSEPAKPKKSGGGKKLKGEDRLPPVVAASA
jgi:transcriptional activator SPT7